MGFKNFFFPKKYDFVAMLYEQSKKTEEGMQKLLEFINSPARETADRVIEIENEADELRRILIERLNKSFITPFDREDIFALSRTIDDMIDYAKSTVEEMILFEIPPNEYFRKIIDALYNASKEITLAIKCLKEYPQTCNEHIIRAKKTENYVEHRYREALVELFKNDNVIEILKTRELYRHLSNAADRSDEAANIIGDILVKIT